jgi:SAM-dependent methyltransferase
MAFNRFKIITPLLISWQRSTLGCYFKERRLRYINALMGGRILSGATIRVLDVGCNNGKDFVRFLDGHNNLELHGVDLLDAGFKQANFAFIQCDAENLPYPDGYFDIAVSVGVLEHITPIEKLSRVIGEINRVSKSYCVIVPSLRTVIEPHVVRYRYPVKQLKRKKNLLHFSDEAWLSFEGFREAEVRRFKYMPFIECQCIYKLQKS